MLARGEGEAGTINSFLMSTSPPPLLEILYGMGRSNHRQNPAVNLRAATPEISLSGCDFSVGGLTFASHATSPGNKAPSTNHCMYQFCRLRTTPAHSRFLSPIPAHRWRHPVVVDNLSKKRKNTQTGTYPNRDKNQVLRLVLRLPQLEGIYMDPPSVRSA